MPSRSFAMTAALLTVLFSVGSVPSFAQTEAPAAQSSAEDDTDARLMRLERVLVEIANRPVIVPGLNVSCAQDTPANCAKAFCVDAGYADGSVVATIPQRPMPPNPVLLTVVACRAAPLE